MKLNLEQLYGYAIITGLALYALFAVSQLVSKTFYPGDSLFLIVPTVGGAIAGTVLGKLIHRTWQFAILGTLAGFDLGAMLSLLASSMGSGIR
jgi:hypothetical protein